MKILFFIPALNAGGSERVMVTLANQWSKKHSITILTLQNTPSFYQLNENVKHIKMGLKIPREGRKRLLLLPLIELKRYCYLVNYLKQHHFDFVLSFTNTTNLLISFWKLFHRKQVIILSERADPVARHVWLRGMILGLYRFADAIVCQNEYVARYFTAHGYKIPLPILPNPVNFNDIPLETSKKRREIVTVGRLSSEKNQALLISAFSEIASRYPAYTLKIYGVGPLENILSKQIAELGLTNRVFLMGNKKRVMFEAAQSDIFVLPSNFEGFPNVLIEAMASGMPVISSDFPTGIARQLIKSGENGYLFPVGDKMALVQALKKMLARHDEWEEMGRINLQIAKQYTAGNISRDWLRNIEHLLEVSK